MARYNVEVITVENTVIVSDVGVQGAPGEQGEPGAQGEQGLQGEDGAPGQGVPVGGTAGQVLAKDSNTDYDTEWIDAGGGTASAIANDSQAQGANVAEALDILDNVNTDQTAMLDDFNASLTILGDGINDHVNDVKHLPIYGATGDVLTKTSNSDYASHWSASPLLRDNYITAALIANLEQQLKSYSPILWHKMYGDNYKTGTTVAALGETVETLIDYSGNGFHSLQNTAGNRGTVIAGIGGRNAIRFNGNVLYNFDAGVSVSSQAFTILVICRNRSDITSCLFRLKTVGFHQLYYGGGKLAIATSDGGGGLGITKYSYRGNSVPALNKIIYKGGTTSSKLKHGPRTLSNTYETATAAQYTAATLAGGTLGQDQSGTLPFHGDMYEFIIFPTELNALQEAVATAYVDLIAGYPTSVKPNMLLGVGNSLLWGYGILTADSDYLNVAVNALGSTWSALNMAVPGNRLISDITPLRDIDVVPWSSGRPKTVVVVDESVNEINTGTTLANMQTGIAAYVNPILATGAYVIIKDCTVAPLYLSAGEQTVRTAYNTWLASIFGGATAHARFFTQTGGPFTGQNGQCMLYKVTELPEAQNAADATYYQGDQLHYTAALDALIGADIATGAALFA